MFKKKSNETNTWVDSKFDSIVENDEIHDVLKKLLNKLHKPYLKIALKSPNLFAYDNHQARMFLQIAIQASVNWHSEYDQKNLFIKKIKSIIKSINKSNKADIYESSNFIKYGEDLEKIIIEINREKKRTLEEKEIATKRINKAKLDGSNTIFALVSEKKLPELVSFIIEEQWLNVLVLMYMRHSKQSEEYKQQIEFITLLIEVSLEENIEQQSKQDFDYLLDMYKEGLKIVAYKSSEIKEYKNKLFEFFTNLSNANLEKLEKEIDCELEDKCLTSSAIDTNLDTNKAPPNKDDLDTNVILDKNDKNIPETTEQTNTLKESKDTEPNVDYQQIVSNLKIGTWFELTDENNSNKKVKLSWISPVSGKFLFVNTNGIKIIGKNTTQLIESLKSNQLRIMNSFN